MKASISYQVRLYSTTVVSFRTKNDESTWSQGTFYHHQRNEMCIEHGSNSLLTVYFVVPGDRREPNTSPTLT